MRISKEILSLLSFSKCIRSKCINDGAETEIQGSKIVLAFLCCQHTLTIAEVQPKFTKLIRKLLTKIVA